MMALLISFTCSHGSKTIIPIVSFKFNSVKTKVGVQTLCEKANIMAMSMILVCGMLEYPGEITVSSTRGVS